MFTPANAKKRPPNLFEDHWRNSMMSNRLTVSLFGIPGTPHVMMNFLKTSASTKHTLRFSNDMSPGVDVHIIMPRVASYLGPQNPDIVTKDY